jgi:hypothetical protein
LGPKFVYPAINTPTIHLQYFVPQLQILLSRSFVGGIPKISKFKPHQTSKLSGKVSKMVSFSRIAGPLLIAIATLVQVAPALPIIFPAVFLGAFYVPMCLDGGIQRRDFATDCPIDPRFSTCIRDLIDGGKVTAHVNGDKSVDVGGLSPACVGQVNEYNSSPDITSLNDKYGTATVLNETSLQLSGMSENSLEKIASMVTIVK